MQVNGTLISTIQTKHLIRRENERNKLTKKKKKKKLYLEKKSEAPLETLKQVFEKNLDAEGNHISCINHRYNNNKIVEIIYLTTKTENWNLLSHSIFPDLDLYIPLKTIQRLWIFLKFIHSSLEKKKKFKRYLWFQSYDIFQFNPPMGWILKKSVFF